MRELASREYTPTLAYAASIVLLIDFVLFAIGQWVAAAAMRLLFAAVLVLLVMRVDAPPWARLAGYGWAALALLGALLVLSAETFGGSSTPGNILATLALLPGAAWVAGASLSDPGAGRALGVAVAVGMLFSALLGFAEATNLVQRGTIVRVISMLTFPFLIAWLAVLARDLDAGRRHWGGHAHSL